MTFLNMPKGRRPLFSTILGTLGAWVLWSLVPTYRWRRVGEVAAEVEMREPVAFVFWHNQQLLMPAIFFKLRRDKFSKGLVALASGHKDGQVIAQIVELCGFRSMSGSSSRGGLESLLAMGRCLKEGYDIGMAPDGPKGPPGESKQGIIALARKYSVAIVPLAYAVSETSAWRFKRAWDKMFLPKPFARISWVVGPALRFARDQDLDQAKLILDAELRRLNEVVIADVA